MVEKPAKPIEIFYSYSHKDEKLRDRLEKHLAILKRQGVITGWHDRRIGAGKEWAGEIDTHLNTAHVILLLISVDFLASDYCYDVEMKRAMERHEAGEARVIPVILRPVDWRGAPFGALQALPKDAVPVTEWPNRDKAFLDVARGIRAAVEELTSPPAGPSLSTSTAFGELVSRGFGRPALRLNTKREHVSQQDSLEREAEKNRAGYGETQQEQETREGEIASTNVSIMGRTPISSTNAEGVTQLARWGKGRVSSIALSPNGQQLAIASSFGAYLYDVQTLQEIRFINTDEYIVSVEFSPNGLLLATGSIPGTIQVWEVETGHRLYTLKSSDGWAHAVFSPDGQKLATFVYYKYPIKLWDISSEREILTLSGHAQAVHCIAFSPNGRLLASGAYDDTLRLWDTETGHELRQLTGHKGTVYSVAFSPDGKLLASGSTDCTVKLWDVASGSKLRTVAKFDSIVETVAFSPDGRKLASADSTVIKVTDVVNGQETRALTGHKIGLKKVVFFPDSKTLVSAASGGDNTIKLWDVETARELHTVAAFGREFKDIAFSLDGQILACASNDTTIVFWDLKSGRELRILSGHESDVQKIEFSPDGKVLASASAQSIKFWGVADGHRLRDSRYPGVAYLGGVAFSHNLRLLAFGSHTNTIKLWDIDKEREVCELRGHIGKVTSLAFSPDQLILASGSEDKTIKLWDLENNRELRMLTGHEYEVGHVIFSPNGKLLASAAIGGGRLWDVMSGRELWKCYHGNRCVAFSPDGQTVAFGSMGALFPNSSITLLDIGIGEELCTLWGHTSWVSCLAFSPDGSLLASAASDGTLRLWGLGDKTGMKDLLFGGYSPKRD